MGKIIETSLAGPDDPIYSEGITVFSRRNLTPPTSDSVRITDGATPQSFSHPSIQPAQIKRLPNETEEEYLEREEEENPAYFLRHHRDRVSWPYPTEPIDPPEPT